MNIINFEKLTLTDFPGRRACKVIIDGYNLSDLYNIRPTQTASAVMSVEELYDFLEKNQSTLDGVIFTGGEPTLHSELMDVMRHIKGYYGLEIKIDTNGTNPDMLFEIICEGIAEYVSMDIKAGPSNYKRAAGVDPDSELWKKIVASRDMLIEEDEVEREFKTVAVGGIHTKQDFEEIRDFIKGGDQYFIESYRPHDILTQSTNLDAGISVSRKSYESAENLLQNTQLYALDKKELESYIEIVRPSVRYAALRLNN